MQFWVGITDKNWFDYLSTRKPDEVNFWQPSNKPPRHMHPGTPFLFKLHSPDDYVVGGGFFVRFTTLPCYLAWEAFGLNNGVVSLNELVARMTRYKHAPQSKSAEIGCNLLTEPFFFPKEDWIRIPENWRKPIQRGLTYDTNDPYGAALWTEVQKRVHSRNYEIEDVPEKRYGTEYLARARLGQGAFRILVTDAYNRRCAVTNEKTLPVLEAAHIKDYSEEGPHRTNNGLLLRADIHRLFDDGYVTIDPDLRFVVSNKVREEFHNGREYYQFHGKQLQNIPQSISDQPSEEFIRWHNDERFERF